MPMKPFTRVTPGIEEGCVSAVSLVDTKGNTFNCNFVEVSPIIGQGALSYFTASVSAQGSPLLGSDTHGSSGVMASAGPMIAAFVGVQKVFQGLSASVELAGKMEKVGPAFDQLSQAAGFLSVVPFVGGGVANLTRGAVGSMTRHRPVLRKPAQKDRRCDR